MLAAVIFDMDGVLVDSFHAHFESWQAVAAEHGIEMTEARFAATFGRTSREIVRALWGETLTDSDIESIDRRKEASYRRIVERRFPRMDGAVELLDSLHAERIALAVGSSGPPENVELALRYLGRRKLFAAVVTGQDVQRGKPDPQVFRVAAERLRVQPGDCLVIEDAPDGIEAARRAGMAAVALLSTGRRREDFADVAPDKIIGSLGEIGPEILRSLVARA